MLEEILEGAVSSFDGFSGPVCRTIARIFFGILGFILSFVGVVHVLSGGIEGVGFHIRSMAAFNFASLGSFCFLNVVLLRPYRWPARAFVSSIGLLFVVRFVFGP